MKRALQVSVVKKQAPGEPPLPESVIDPEVLNEIVKDQVQNAVKAVGALLLMKKAADTASELILIAGRKYL